MLLESFLLGPPLFAILRNQLTGLRSRIVNLGVGVLMVLGGIAQFFPLGLYVTSSSSICLQLHEDATRSLVLHKYIPRHWFARMFCRLIVNDPHSNLSRLEGYA